jgi:hypothetical protein
LESLDSKIREKYGEFNSLLPKSERLLESYSLLKKKTQEDFLKVLPFLEEWLDMVY